jgi:hypothetical protein
MNDRTDNTRQSCPVWCTAGSEEYPCDGEHRTTSAYGYVPATASHVHWGTPEGTSMNAIAAGLSWPEDWGEGHSLTLHLVGGEKDESIDFKPSEALTFATSVVEMLACMVQGGVQIMFDIERVLELIENAESIRDAHKRTAVEQ